jgi:hypothetical protein
VHNVLDNEISICCRRRANLSTLDIERLIQDEFDDPLDDSDLDPDYKDSEDDSNESTEEEASKSTPAVTGFLRQGLPTDALTVFVDPPLERADGDTDRDSG